MVLPPSSLQRSRFGRCMRMDTDRAVNPADAALSRGWMARAAGRRRPAPGAPERPPLAALVAFDLDRTEHVPSEQRGRFDPGQLPVVGVAARARDRTGPEALGGVGARRG